MGCRERKLKDPCIIHVARIKQILERTVELDKPRGNGKHVRARKAMDLDGSGVYIRLRHHLPVRNQYRRGEPQVKDMRGCGQVVGRRGSLFWGSHSTSFGRVVLLG